MMKTASNLDHPSQDRQIQPVALVVEDEMLVRMVLVDILMDDGFEVIEATTGDEALLTLRRRADVSVIVTDVEMPGTINGFGLAHHVARERPGSSIVVVSGRAAPEIGDMPEGARFLAKPCLPEVLLGTVNDMIARRSLAE